MKSSSYWDLVNNILIMYRYKRDNDGNTPKTKCKYPNLCFSRSFDIRELKIGRLPGKCGCRPWVVYVYVARDSVWNRIVFKRTFRFSLFKTLYFF